MITKQITFFGKETKLVCDAKCNKAWGINRRPKIQLSDDIDDYEWLSDRELEDAPLEVDTSEGGDTKPKTKEERLNKWCARECERSKIVKNNEDFELLDFNTRVKNIR